jgi:putative transposase
MDLRERIVRAILEEEITRQEAAKRYEVGIATVYRFLQLKRDLNDLSPATSPGRPPIIAQQDHEKLIAQVKENSDFTLDEHSALWQEKTGQVVHRATMHNTIKRLKISRKKRR